MSPNIIFGPVNSRRFGKSLGIDLSPSKKVCNFDCLYCELEGAKPTQKIENPLRVDEIISQLQIALEKYKDIDVITITANGEPTLYPYLKELVEEINRIKKSHKLLILSNSSTLGKREIQEALLGIDIVKLSLDCATNRCFKRIDRPHKSIELSTIIESIKKFKKIYKGSLIIEILVVEGINDKEEEFEELNRVLNEIKPHRVDLGTIDRPPAYEVRGVSIDRLIEFGKILNNLHVSLSIRRDGYSGEKLELSKEKILTLLKRRPQSFDEIDATFSSESRKILELLLEDGKIITKEVAGVKFYGVG